MYGCGGVCKKFNHGICMSACSMDNDSRKEFVKKLVADRNANGTPDNVHDALGTGKVLKPINPNAYAFLTDKPKPAVEESSPTQPVTLDAMSQEDISEIRRFTI